MIRGLRTAAAGMAAESAIQDVIANNIANASAPGFKRRAAIHQTFDTALTAELARSSRMDDKENRVARPISPVVAEAVDTSPGSFTQTGNHLDFALEGPGYFVLESTQGHVLTRNGSFTANEGGELISSSGLRVLGTNGPIRVPSGEWSVDSQGNVVSKGSVVDTIKTAMPGSVSVSGGDGLVRAATLLPSTSKIRQGELELSNVDVVREMVTMISNMRAFERNQKVIQSIDSTLGTLVNEVSRIK